MIGLGWATLYNTIIEKYENCEKCQKPSTLVNAVIRSEDKK